jgi:hypothetical protein
VTRVSIIIPVKDDPPVFAAVASVAGLEHEVILVDNGSAAAFRAQLASLPAGVRVVDQAKPGPAAARNQGVAEATGEVIFFLDADCVAHPGWVEAGLRALEVGEADIAGGRSLPRPRTKAAEFVRRTWKRPPDHETSQRLVYVDTKNLAVRRAVFDRVRFREELPRYEDHQFGFEAKGAGFRLTRAPKMLIDFEPDESVALHAAKMMGTGWARAFTVAARMRAGGKPRGGRRSKMRARMFSAVSGRAWAVTLLARTVLLTGRTIDAAAPALPLTVGGWLARRAASLARTTGQAMQAAGFAAPVTGDLLAGRMPPRDGPGRHV